MDLFTSGYEFTETCYYCEEFKQVATYLVISKICSVPLCEDCINKELAKPKTKATMTRAM